MHHKCDHGMRLRSHSLFILIHRAPIRRHHLRDRLAVHPDNATLSQEMSVVQKTADDRQMLRKIAVVPAIGIETGIREAVTAIAAMIGEKSN